MTVKCPKCHFDNPPDTVYCGQCATPLPHREAAAPPQTETLRAALKELTRGSTFAHRYEVIEELGRGGMGKVYRVFDKKVDEEIALKLVKSEIAADQETISRFSSELRLARKIAHRNVGKMYELMEDEGTHFITMEYIPGENLKSMIRMSGQLSTGTTISIAKQICEGLAEAHRHGVVHRDLKPSNLMIDRAGTVRIMDFGIARSLKTKGLTGAGAMIGTPEYMSPEQVEGKEVDQRSDIYSLGIVLYEMLTGRVPFEGDTPFSIGMKHTREAPRNPQELNAQIPSELSRVILRCLEKDRAKRYQSVADISLELVEVEKGLTTGKRGLGGKHKVRESIGHGWRRTPVFVGAFVLLAAIVAAVLLLRPGQKETIDSIAVLYFANLNPGPDTDYISDGLTESLIGKLQELPSLKRVISSSSVERYKGQAIDPQRFGSELGVRALLAGKIRKVGEELSATVELVDVKDGSLIWSHTYAGKLAEVLGLPEDISREISGRLRLHISKEEKERLAKRSTTNVEAHQAYLKGQFYWNKRTKDALLKGLEYFAKAIEYDPAYALAYSGLADSYALLSRYTYLAPDEGMPKAKAAALKALEIDDTLGEAHNSLAFVIRFYDYDWPGAERECRRAIELSPNYATAHHWYGLQLAQVGRHEEAMKEMRRALELDPLSLIINTNVAWNSYFARDYDQAIELFQKALDMDPNYAVAHSRLADTYVQKGMFREAISEVQKAIDLSPESTDILAELGYACGISGNEAEAKKVLGKLMALAQERYVSPYDLAIAYLGLGQKSMALDLLDKAYTEHASFLAFMKVDPRVDPLRSDARFKALAKKMNLE